MRKIVLALVACAVAVCMAGLVGCGGSASNAPKYEVGDTLTMGSFNGEELSWTVIDVTDDAALVIAADEITRHSFANADEDGNYSPVWADSYAREYLNGEFLNSAFSSDEAAAIVDTEIEAAGATSTDKVFFLTAEQLETLFADDASRADLEGGWYYSITPAANGTNLIVVFGDGSMYDFGFAADGPGGFRPAMWIAR